MKARMISATLMLLVIFLGATSFAEASRNGIYKGETASGYEVRIKVKKNRIAFFDTDVYASCYSGSFGTSFVFPPAGRKDATGKINRNGTFRIVFTGNPRVSFNDDKRIIKGRLTGSRVTGSVKVEGLCSGSSTYSARK